MKSVVQLVKCICLVVLCGLVIVSCNKNNSPEVPEIPSGNQGDSINADTISNHLQFMGAIKKTGALPQAPTNALLKISFKDTLYLSDEVKTPIKFLHEDTTKNVAGIFVQVQATFAGGTGATYYYDVPEVPDVADNDTVSVIMVGVDPVGLIDTDGVPPAGSPRLTIIITIIPYGKDRQPIAKADRPVVIADPTIDPLADCGIVLPPGEYWDWHMSYILNPDGNTFSFYNDQDKIHGANGQFIGGSCCDGLSVYGICPGDSMPNRSLHFPTFFQYAEEGFIFHPDGTFARFTRMLSADPLPLESDFCAGGEGVVNDHISLVTYAGNWSIIPTVAPPELQHYGDSLRLILQGTSSTGGGYGNPGGIIHHLNCNFLTLIQTDTEGGNRHLYKYYTRMTSLGAWYLFA
jgi:hypothetical protein